MGITTLLLVQLLASQPAPDRAPAAEDAGPAIAVVERFHAALASGDLERAAAELHPELIVLESGGAEHSAAEYLGGHALADARFLRDARQVPLRRHARAGGGLAWVASESELHFEREGRPVVHASVETMVLAAGRDGWKIVHIHWSSRALAPAGGPE